MNDFRKINNRTVDDHNDAHESDLAWLRKELGNIDPGRSVLIVTHHAPSVLETSRPEHLENPWTSTVATSLLSTEDDKTWSAVRHWVYGHTHYSAEFEKCGIRLVSNQRGYVVPGSITTKSVDERFDVGKNIQWS